MKRDFARSRGVLLSACTAILAAWPVLAAAADQNGSTPDRPGLSIKAADPAEQGDGTLGPAAKRALTRGPLPTSAAIVAAKAAADHAYREAVQGGQVKPASPAELAPAGGAAGPLAP